MKNPKATLHMANGTDIVIELLPEAAPNTVNSFIYAASHGYLDHHAIERIVPGNWVDVSYTAFGHKELQYLIPNEFALNQRLRLLTLILAVYVWADMEKQAWQAANSSSLCGTARITKALIRYSARLFPVWTRSVGSQQSKPFP